MNRKKKLRIIQFSLLLISLIILIFSYSNRFKLSDKDIISEEIQNKVDEQLSKVETLSIIYLLAGSICLEIGIF